MYFNGGNVGFNVSFPSTALEIDGEFVQRVMNLFKNVCRWLYDGKKYNKHIKANIAIYYIAYGPRYRQALAHKVLLNDTTAMIFSVGGSSEKLVA